MNCTQDRFLKDVANHKMTIIRDDGFYRHVEFSRPDTNCYQFDLITWPGYLCYCGDMGTYVFRRLEDMFEFFRTDRRDKGKLYINLSYWSEKLQAVDGNRQNGSAMEFSEEKFRRVINEYRVSWMREAKECGALTKAERRELWESVDSEVLMRIDDGEHAVCQAAHDFEWKKDTFATRGPSWYFRDLFDHGFTDYTFHFVWCSYALAWGIKSYDEHKKAETEKVAA